MEELPKVTEVSLYLTLQTEPRTPLDSATPFVVDNRGYNTERVVSAHTDVESLPDWLIDCQKGYLKFTYVSGHQNIECTFRKELSLLTINGVKYANYSAFLNLEVCKIFDLLNTRPASNPKTMYKATMVKYIGTVWDRDVIADIITNNYEVSQVAAVSEKVSTLGNRCLFSVSVKTGMHHGNVEDPDHEHGYARITLRNDDVDNKKIVVTMSRLQDVSCSVRVAGIIDKIIDAYGKQCLNDDDGLDTEEPCLGLGLDALSGIKALRDELPELFINNYTRECPVLPVMLSKEQADIVSGYKRVIFYPVNSCLGRFYTAPSGYFVGLKKNRLANKDTFPCLVTCYLHDHMLREGSETYMYYMGSRAEAKNKDRGKQLKPIPRFLDYGISKYHANKDKPCLYDRVRATSFVNAIEVAINKKIDTGSLPWCPQVVKQEMWNVPDTTIMDMIKNKECKPLAYRFFEELLGLSIHVIAIKGGMLEPLVPVYKQGHKYIWEPPYDNHIIIFETTRVAYRSTNTSYDVLVDKKGTAVFGNNDPAVMYVVSSKMAESVRPDRLRGLNVVEQLIDERGKCRIVTTDKGECVATFTRPLTVPVMPKTACFLDSHVNKMNVLKVAMGLPTTDLYKRSTNDMLYFPNDQSFKYWLEKRLTQRL